MAALGLSVIGTILGWLLTYQASGGHAVLTTCPVAAFIMVPGSWQLSATTDSAAAPGQQVWGKMGVVHLLHHQARNASTCTVTLLCLAAGQ